MSRDVQRYNRNVYLRVSEAQRCRVHSTLVVPVFMQHEPQSPAAILELVQNDKDCVFPEIMSSLSQCLEVSMHITTSSSECNAAQACRTAAEAVTLQVQPTFLHETALTST